MSIESHKRQNEQNKRADTENSQENQDNREIIGLSGLRENNLAAMAEQEEIQRKIEEVLIGLRAEEINVNLKSTHRQDIEFAAGEFFSKNKPNVPYADLRAAEDLLSGEAEVFSRLSEKEMKSAEQEITIARTIIRAAILAIRE